MERGADLRVMRTVSPDIIQFAKSIAAYPKEHPMSESATRIKDELLKLDSQDRAELAHFLIGTLDHEDDENVEDAWHEELIRRNAEIEAGTAVGIPAEQVFKALREKFS